MTYALAINSVYNIAMKAPAILSAGYTAAKVLIPYMDYATAKSIEDITPIHDQVYSQLGTGIPRDPKDLIYVKIKTSTGQIRALAHEWIAAQPTVVSATNIRIELADVDLSRISELREILLVNNFPNITITTF